MGVFGFDGVDDPDWMGGSIVVVVVGGGVGGGGGDGGGGGKWLPVVFFVNKWLEDNIFNCVHW